MLHGLSALSPLVEACKQRARSWTASSTPAAKEPANHARIIDPHHFILLQHGLLGRAADFDSLVKLLIVDHMNALRRARSDTPAAQKTSGSQVVARCTKSARRRVAVRPEQTTKTGGKLYRSGNRVCFASNANGFLSSIAGTRACAVRLLEEFLPLFNAWLDKVEAEAREARVLGSAPAGVALSTPVCFSCVGHSFGGLILREFLFLLLVDCGELAGSRATLYATVLATRARMRAASVTLENFVTLATPHCGTAECLLPAFVKIALAIAHLGLAPTLDELMLKDSEHLLRTRLIDGPHLAALSAFRHRTLFANTYRDLFVGFGTSSLLFEQLARDDTCLLSAVPDVVPCAVAFRDAASEVSEAVYLPPRATGAQPDKPTCAPRQSGRAEVHVRTHGAGAAAVVPPFPTPTHTVMDVAGWLRCLELYDQMLHRRANTASSPKSRHTATSVRDEAASDDGDEDDDSGAAEVVPSAKQVSPQWGSTQAATSSSSDVSNEAEFGGQADTPADPVAALTAVVGSPVEIIGSPTHRLSLQLPAGQLSHRVQSEDGGAGATVRFATDEAEDTTTSCPQTGTTWGLVLQPAGVTWGVLSWVYTRVERLRGLTLLSRFGSGRGAAVAQAATMSEARRAHAHEGDGGGRSDTAEEDSHDAPHHPRAGAEKETSTLAVNASMFEQFGPLPETQAEARHIAHILRKYLDWRVRAVRITRSIPVAHYSCLGIEWVGVSPAINTALSEEVVSVLR